MIQPLLLLFLASLGLNWPDLPANARLPDLLFIPVVIALAIDGARPSFRRLEVIVLVYVLGAAPSLAASPDPASGLTELARETYLIAIYFTIVAAIRRGYLHTIATGLALSGAVLAVLGLAFELAKAVVPFEAPAMGYVMSMPYIGSVLRLRALTASEAMLACVLTMAVPFAIAKWAEAGRGPQARVWAALTLSTGAAVALTFSHATAGFTVAAVIGSWPFLKPLPWLRRAAVAAAIVAMVAFNSAASISVRAIDTATTDFADSSPYHYGVGSGRVTIGTATIDYQVMSYLRLKQLALEAWLANPVLGVGLDRFHDVSQRAFEQGRLTLMYRDIDPHSTLLGRLAETGLIGGATLLLLWIVFFREGVSLLMQPGGDAWIARAVVAGLAGILVNSVNADVMNFRFVWVGLGIIGGMADRR